MDIQKILRTYQSLAVSLAVLIFCVIAFFGGVLPSIQKVSELFLTVQSLTEDNKGLEKKIQILDGYDEEDLRAKLAIVLSTVPGDKGLPGLFGTVEAVAGSAGVTIVDMNVVGGKVATTAATKQTKQELEVGSRILHFTTTVVGSLPAMQDFITRVPTVRRLMRIRSFAITFPKNDKPLTVSLALDAFYEPYVTSLGGAASVVSALSTSELAIIDTLSTFPLVVQTAEALPEPTVGQIKLNPFIR